MVLRDSTNPLAIPVGTPYVGGYVDGLYGPVWASQWRRFPGAKLRRIACVTVTTRSNTADVERFDLTSTQAPIWVRNMQRLGEVDLWVYCNRSNQKPTEDAMWGAGIRSPEVSMWIATLDGTMVVPAYRYRVAAVQYKDFGGYDESVVYEGFKEGSAMLYRLQTPANAVYLWNTSTDLVQGLDATENAAFSAAGVSAVAVSQGFVDNIKAASSTGSTSKITGSVTIA